VTSRDTPRKKYPPPHPRQPAPWAPSAPDTPVTRTDGNASSETNRRPQFRSAAPLRMIRRYDGVQNLCGRNRKSSRRETPLDVREHVRLDGSHAESSITYHSTVRRG